ncbi:MAG TPA: Hpt domain-containing protein, partial [Pseudomonas sp.]|nr:Hpt domain-containing protein [Pseudomonas sp.]
RDIPGLDQAGALQRMLGNRALYLRMLQRSHEEYATLPADLRDMLADGRREEAAELLHRVKSIIATLGAVRLEVLAGEFEAALLAERDGAAELEAFEAEFIRLRAAVQETLEDAAGAP